MPRICAINFGTGNNHHDVDDLLLRDLRFGETGGQKKHQLSLSFSVIICKGTIVKTTQTTITTKETDDAGEDHGAKGCDQARAKRAEKIQLISGFRPNEKKPILCEKVFYL